MRPELRDIDVIVLDQGETFMFGNDRFGPSVNYAETYRRIGGRRLPDQVVNDCVQRIFEALVIAYDSRTCDDRFPTVRDIASELDIQHEAEEIELLDDVIAEHEIGIISEAHRKAIHNFTTTHRVGIISNVFAQPARFEHNLQQAGIFGCFEHIAWSSAHRMIKPSPALFRVSIDHWGVEPSRTLYVGNDARRDVGGSQSVGMKSAWIDIHRTGLPAGIPKPDIIVRDLAELNA